MTDNIFTDALFACIAAIGFGSINNPARNMLHWCGIIAAAGHATRYLLMNGTLHAHIILASLVASLIIGSLSLYIANRKHCPSEMFSFPALLPMIPGMYAYGTVQAMISYLRCHSEGVDTMHYLDMFVYNGLMTILIILMMVIGITLPKTIYKN